MSCEPKPSAGSLFSSTRSDRRRRRLCIATSAIAARRSVLGAGRELDAGGPPAKPPSIAPPDSLEAQALASSGTGVRYVERGELARLGAIASHAMGETFSRVPWAEVVDDMVVFREERPPMFVGGLRPQRAE